MIRYPSPESIDLDVCEKCLMVVDAAGASTPLALAWIVVNPGGVIIESTSRLLNTLENPPLNTLEHPPLNTLELGVRLTSMGITTYHIQTSPYPQHKEMAELRRLAEYVVSLSGRVVFATQEASNILLELNIANVQDVILPNDQHSVINLHQNCVSAAKKLFNSKK